MKDIMNVAVVTYEPRWGDKERNLNRIIGYLECAAARGANLVVLPETALTGYDADLDHEGDERMHHRLAEPIPGPSTEAVAEATKKGYLRPSMVDPLTRVNSGNNTGKGVPNIEYEYVPGQKYVDFIISFKGCGAELGNAMQIMTTAKLGKNLSGLKRFILETAINAGGKPCPPYGIGIGIGGQMDVAAKLSRKAISTRRWDDVNPDPELATLETELKDAINSLGLGAAGTGGDTVCLALKMERAHTHTAIAPVCINFHCWVARRAGIRIHDDGHVEKLL